jgi:hypothetical protein
MIQQLGIVKHSSILDHAVVLRGRHLDRPKAWQPTSMNSSDLDWSALG